AVGWIDGELGRDEADAILRAAREEGLPEEVIEGLQAAARSPIPFDDIEVAKLTTEDRLYIYAMTSWIAQVDGVEEEREQPARPAGATLLGVTGKGRKLRDETGAGLAAREDAPDRLDLRGLRDAIGSGLAAR